MNEQEKAKKFFGTSILLVLVTWALFGFCVYIYINFDNNDNLNCTDCHYDGIVFLCTINTTNPLCTLLSCQNKCAIYPTNGLAVSCENYKCQSPQDSAGIIFGLILSIFLIISTTIFACTNGYILYRQKNNIPVRIVNGTEYVQIASAPATELNTSV